MSRVPVSSEPFVPKPRATPPPVEAPNPTWLDFFVLLLGCGLSLFMTQLIHLEATRTDQTPQQRGIEPLLRILPDLLFLSLGPILLWPFFYATQRVRGRSQSLSAAEWLLGFAWLATAVLAGWLGWEYWGTLPRAIAEIAFRKYLVVGHTVAFLSLGGLAVLILLVNLIGRWPQPWTHRLSIALLGWPLVPLALVFLWKIDLRIPLPPH